MARHKTGRRQYLFDHVFAPSGHYLHHLSSRLVGGRHPFGTPLLRRVLSSGEPKEWQDLPAHLLCQIASNCELATLRAVCSAWRARLDASLHCLEPAVCHAERIAALWPNLRTLDLSACSVTVEDASIAALARLTQLSCLDMSGCAAVSEAGIAAAAACSSLQEISLGRDPELPPEEGLTVFDSKVSDGMLRALAGAASLHTICIGHSCKCTCAGVLALTRLGGLRALAVTGHSREDFGGALTGADLRAFGALSALRSLSVGVVEPAAFRALTCLTRLTTLSLHGDSWERPPLAGEELRHLGQLTCLQQLGLHDFELTGGLEGGGAATAFLRSLVRLRCLALDGCRLAPCCELLALQDAAHVGRLQFRVATADLEADIRQLEQREEAFLLTELGELPQLAATALDLQSDALTPGLLDAVLACAPRLRCLKWACGSAAGFADEPPPVSLAVSQWACQARLEVLEVGGGLALCPQTLQGLAACPRLAELVCSTRGALPPGLAAMTALTSLCVSWTAGGDEGMAALCRLTGLQCLHAACADPIQDTGLAHVAALTGLTELVLHSKTVEPRVSAAGLRAVAACRRLEKLELVSAVLLGAEALAALGPLAELRQLDVGSFAEIDDALIAALRPLGRLRRLWLRIPRERLWQHRSQAIAVSLAGVAGLAEAHPLLSFVCFANRQVASLPRVALDRRQLQALAQAHAGGGGAAVEELPFWMPQA